MFSFTFVQLLSITVRKKKPVENSHSWKTWTHVEHVHGWFPCKESDCTLQVDTDTATKTLTNFLYILLCLSSVAFSFYLCAQNRKGCCNMDTFQLHKFSSPHHQRQHQRHLHHRIVPFIRQHNTVQHRNCKRFLSSSPITCCLVILLSAFFVGYYILNTI